MILAYNEGFDRPIGVGGFTRIEWKNRKAEITFYIGDFEFNRSEVVKDTLRLIIESGFNQMNFHKLYFPVYSDNPNLKHYQDVMHEEAVMKEEYWRDGWKDRHILVSYNPLDKS